MKKIYLFILIMLLGTACNDNFMERYPIAELSPEIYFRREAELKNYTNAFYNKLPAAIDIHYNHPTSADDEGRSAMGEEVQGIRITPTLGGGWDWTELRRINFFLENSYKCEDEAVRLKYEGIARFFRAYFYFEKVVRFADVPWYDYVLEMDDQESLTKSRDSRKFIFDKILEDLDFAIKYGNTTVSGELITKWTALAYKTRMCLFEGTYRKYHNLGDHESILDKCIAAAEELMAAGKYKIYKSLPDKAYHELFIAENAITEEMILARTYSKDIPFVHSANFYILSASYGRPGVLKSLVDSYLMIDGSRFTDKPGYEKMDFYEESQNRDPRMSQTMRTPGYQRIGTTRTSVPDFSACVTGYQIIKYVMGPEYDVGNQSNDIPLIRYAEVLLNYAEAKAERRTLTQSDIDKSIKLIRDRVGMPNLNLATANANPDPYLIKQYPNADKGVILEIRRERRIELYKEGLRYRDLMRWKEGAKVAEPFYGMYFKGTGEYDLDRDGNLDLVIYEGTAPTKQPGVQYQKLGELVLENGNKGGRIIVLPGIVKKWTETKDYLYPIPLQELLLNPNLKQNLGWDEK